MNIKDFKETDDQHRTGEEKLWIMFEQSPIAIEVYDIKGRLVDANRACLDMFGISELKYILGFDLFADPNVNDDAKQRLAKGENVSFESVFDFDIVKERNLYPTIKSGKCFIDCMIHPLLDAAGEFTGYIVYVRDINERKLIQEELQKSEERFRLIFENSPVGITHFDSKGTVIECNEHLANIIGAPRENIIGVNMPSAFKDKHQKAAMNEALNGRIGFFEGECTSLTGDKTSYIRTIYAPIFASDGAILGGLSLTEDITQRKRDDELLRASLEEKTVLLNEVHHRVKNNLQIVSSLLSLQALRAKNREVLETLRDTSNRIYSMAMLHETLYRSGNLAQANFPDYIRRICDHIIHSHGSSRINLEYHLANIALDIDRTVSCGLIINELVSNSLKHAFPGRRKGKILVELQVLPDEILDLRVSDDGIGIRKGLEPGKTETLGLKLVSMLVEKLRGDIEIICKRGTTFRITFKKNRYI